MAILVQVFIHDALPAPEGWDFVISMSDDLNHSEFRHEAQLNLGFGQSATSWNDAIAAYARAYAETNWGTVFAPPDRVAILNSFDKYQA